MNQVHVDVLQYFQDAIIESMIESDISSCKLHAQGEKFELKLDNSCKFFQKEDVTY